MLDLSQIKITPRDHQVLDLLVQGCSNKEIAAELKRSTGYLKDKWRALRQETEQVLEQSGDKSQEPSKEKLDEKQNGKQNGKTQWVRVSAPWAS